ncbi:unnamed protein product [Sphagnum jensenii]|uniref:Uncharacterized protein n=1 Tax=Sphagnum jensenii TaxID=128206 RepID=A0ABP1BEK3_9BRYO
MFSVDFLELGGFRQIDICATKGVKEEEEEEEEGWKGLGGRFGIQRIKLIHLSSDHTCKVFGCITNHQC